MCSWLGVIAFCPNEKERTHARTVILCPLPYMWCRCRGALRAAFRCSALRTTRRPEVCRYRDHRGEIELTPDNSTRLLSCDCALFAKKHGVGREVRASAHFNWLSCTPSDKIASPPAPRAQTHQAR